MKKFILLIVFAALWTGIAVSQGLRIRKPEEQVFKPVLKSQDLVKGPTAYQSLKNPGNYTTEDWRALIDTFWGPGVPTAQKLAVFDDFWNKVDSFYGGFPNLYVNWDSLKSVYRPIVEAGVSRGRFAGILSRLTNALQEWHTGIYDYGIDSTLGKYHSGWKIGEYPNYQSFHYQAGIR